MNPRNWALWRKGVVVGIVSAITFFSPLASSMFAPGIPSVMDDFNTTNESLGTFCVSVYILVFPALCAAYDGALLRVRYFGRRYLRCTDAPQYSILPISCSLHSPSVAGFQIAWPHLLSCDSLQVSMGPLVLPSVAA